MKKKRLVADVGGTNIRLALCSLGSTELENIDKIPCANFSSLEQALRSYLDKCRDQYPQPVQISEACLAVAGPAHGDKISMTNLPWSFSCSALKQTFQLDAIGIINDFEAVAQAIPSLQSHELTQIGGPIIENRQSIIEPIAAIGAGTGLGMASVVNVNGVIKVFPAEGGHATIAAQTEEEHSVVRYFIKQGIEPAALNKEFFISGRGLVAIHQALGGSNKTADEISSQASAGTDGTCTQALTLLCNWLGSLCGDQALSLGARGGVYIAGGMVKKFLPFFLNSNFRQRFEDKGKMHEYLQAIPCYVIQRDHVALLGTAATQLY